MFSVVNNDDDGREGERRYPVTQQVQEHVHDGGLVEKVAVDAVLSEVDVRHIH